MMRKYDLRPLIVLLVLSWFFAPRLIEWNGLDPVMTVMAQEEAGAAAAPAKPGRLTTLWDSIQTGGVTMIPIGFFSIWMMSLVVELILKLRSKITCPPDAVQSLQTTLGEHDYLSAMKIARETPSVLTRILERALLKLNKGEEAVEQNAGEALMDENNEFRSKISYLGVIAAVAPMMGLLGTVSGMIKAFDKMGNEGAIGDPAALAGDIGEALITTYAGLTVAIPSMIAFYLMGNRLKKAMTNVQRVYTSLMDDTPYDKIPADLSFDDEDVPRELDDTGVVAVTDASEQAAPAPAPAQVQVATPPPVAVPPVVSATPPAPEPAPVAAAATAEPEEELNCPECGAAIAHNVEACPGCGTAFNWD
ncbi:MAG: MotA/TolQ/ExbB proton channel family protein [Kiritimatiellia bacterium]